MQSPGYVAIVTQRRAHARELRSEAHQIPELRKFNPDPLVEINRKAAAIAGPVEVLKGSKSLTQQEQRLMSIILKESDRLNKTIAEFLRFVRPQEFPVQRRSWSEWPCY